MRYSRHIIMPQVGPQGQRKLRNAKVLVSAPAASAARSRCTSRSPASAPSASSSSTWSTSRTSSGRSCTRRPTSAGRSSSRRKTSCSPTTRTCTCRAQDADHVRQRDGHHPELRHRGERRGQLRDALPRQRRGYLAGKTLVDGAILLFDGQATVYKPGSAATAASTRIRPPPGLVPSCAEAGVLGAITGIVGSIQATEVFKQILEHRRAAREPPAADRRAHDGVPDDEDPARPEAARCAAITRR